MAFTPVDPTKYPANIFGLHDTGGESLIHDAGRVGWIVVTVGLSAGDSQGDFSALANSGYGVIVRLNNGYESAGTIPPRAQYDAFAQQCAAFVAQSHGARIWIIGNETNSRDERPGNVGGVGGEVITPDLYAECFAKCRAAIKGQPGHADDWLIPSPPSPWNTDTQYPSNPSGDWVRYFQDTLNLCVQRGAPPDALALHTYTHGFQAELIAADIKMAAPFNNRNFNFRAYRDFLGVVPPSLRLLPVFITETQPTGPDYWQDSNIGWIQAAYAEINAWNAVAGNQPIQAVCLFRWANAGSPGWVLSTRPALLDDLKAALTKDYRVRWPKPPPPPVALEGWCPFAVKRPITPENYAQGRNGQMVKAVVLHIAAGPLTAVFPTFNNPSGASSAHFCIGKNGAIEQYVSINDTAFANGLRWLNGQWLTPFNKPVSPSWVGLTPPINPNYYTVSIEHEGFPQDDWTPAMYEANDRLLQWIAARCNVTYVPHRTLIGHYEIDPLDRPNCPGPHVEYERIAADANRVVDAAGIAAYSAAKALTWIPQDAAAPLYAAAQQQNAGCALTAQFDVMAGGVKYRAQVFEQGIAYMKADGAAPVLFLPASPSGPLPVEPVAAAVYAQAKQMTWMTVATGSALYQYAQAAGYGCQQTDEFEFIFGGEKYVGQVYKPTIVYAKRGDDSHVSVARKAETAALAEAKARTWMPIYTGGALYQFALHNQLGYPQTDEFDFTVNNQPCVAQVYQKAVIYVKIGDWANVKTTPKPDGGPAPADPVAAAAQIAARQHAWMPINVGSALYNFAQNEKLGYPQTDEFEFTLDDGTYVAQVYEGGITYVKRGDYGNCQWLKKPS
ncbi:MAG: N-acetylmuramoyl-L-alanine amidase [Chloroflexi bacterium]|nr:N-acetylmuramoyl-L-alanine amidase [Chloroflexota bacterium]